MTRRLTLGMIEQQLRYTQAAMATISPEELGLASGSSSVVTTGAVVGRFNPERVTREVRRRTSRRSSR